MLTTSVQVYPSVHLQSLKGPCLSPHFSHGFFTQAGGVLGFGLVLGLVLGLGLALGVGLALGPGLVLGDSAGDGLAAGFWHLYSSSCTQGQDRNTMLGQQQATTTHSPLSPGGQAAACHLCCIIHVPWRVAKYRKQRLLKAKAIVLAPTRS